MQIEQLPGLEAEHVSRLQTMGICSCRQLLRASRRRDQSLVLSEVADLSPDALQSLAERIKLCQIRGIGPRTLEQLWAVGVGSVDVLAKQDPIELQTQLRRAAIRPPNLAIVEDWILQALWHKGGHTAESL